MLDTLLLEPHAERSPAVPSRSAVDAIDSSFPLRPFM
jgi:hypothetical protein